MKVTPGKHGIKCPQCGGATGVIDTRLLVQTPEIRRRRACVAGHRFTTKEAIVSTSRYSVQGIEVHSYGQAMALARSALVIAEMLVQKREEGAA